MRRSPQALLTGGSQRHIATAVVPDPSPGSHQFNVASNEDGIVVHHSVPPQSGYAGVSTGSTLQTLTLRSAAKQRVSKGEARNSPFEGGLRPGLHPSRRPASLFELRRAPQDEDWGFSAREAADCAASAMAIFGDRYGDKS